MATIEINNWFQEQKLLGLSDDAIEILFDDLIKDES